MSRPKVDVQGRPLMSRAAALVLDAAGSILGDPVPLKRHCRTLSRNSRSVTSDSLRRRLAGVFGHSLLLMLLSCWICCGSRRLHRVPHHIEIDVEINVGNSILFSPSTNVRASDPACRIWSRYSGNRLSFIRAVPPPVVAGGISATDLRASRDRRIPQAVLPVRLVSRPGQTGCGWFHGDLSRSVNVP